MRGNSCLRSQMKQRCGFGCAAALAPNPCRAKKPHRRERSLPDLSALPLPAPVHPCSTLKPPALPQRAATREESMQAAFALSLSMPSTPWPSLMQSQRKACEIDLGQKLRCLRCPIRAAKARRPRLDSDAPDDPTQRAQRACAPSRAECNDWPAFCDVFRRRPPSQVVAPAHSQACSSGSTHSRGQRPNRCLAHAPGAI